MLEDVVLAWRAHALRHATESAPTATGPSGSCDACDASAFARHEAIPRDAPHSAMHPLLQALETARAEAAQDARERLYLDSRGPVYRDHPFGVPAFVDYGERSAEIQQAVDAALVRELAPLAPVIRQALDRIVNLRLEELEGEIGPVDAGDGTDPEPLF
ncbi:hypothetical protein BFL36_06825 [Clavibacter michiganensis]|uniref:Uncharacterized protein n=1 Tax=Clavibacter michiganensis TaxID=28447 RepID=A0A251YIU9_9MICO|nr:hypothetical protein [Clavibacter michiganensis]OUE24079.1 hypothetical protein BFL36_06825 [Clavibacter michiganensis]